MNWATPEFLEVLCDSMADGSPSGACERVELSGMICRQQDTFLLFADKPSAHSPASLFLTDMSGQRANYPEIPFSLWTNASRGELYAPHWIDLGD